MVSGINEIIKQHDSHFEEQAQNLLRLPIGYRSEDVSTVVGLPWLFITDRHQQIIIPSFASTRAKADAHFDAFFAFLIVNLFDVFNPCEHFAKFFNRNFCRCPISSVSFFVLVAVCPESESVLRIVRH